MSHDERKRLVVPSHDELSIGEQAGLLGISCSSFYYAPRKNPEDKKHMDMIDAIYTDYPKTSVAHPEHRKYPYLLSGITASSPNHIWGTDITYLKLEEGWAYLVALIDWYSRYVLSWEVSLTMETDFCITTLQSALAEATPKIHNSDQGVPFTDKKYVAVLEESGALISMDGRGRCMDNIFTERLWRTVKYENVFLKSYRNASEAREGLSEYFSFYNKKRRHQSLDYRTPETVYFTK